MDNRKNQVSLGEQQINPQAQQQIVPEVTQPQGQTELAQKVIGAHMAKVQLDAVMEALASHLGATINSRVKNIDTAVKKIATKRLEGRKGYDIESVNDFLGERLILKSDKDLPKAKEAIKKLSEAGIFTIDKQEDVKRNTYSAYHFDVTLSNNTHAEIQIMNKKQEAESLVNHGIRSQFGETPQDDAVKQLREKQANMINNMSNDKAMIVSQAMKNIQKQSSQPIPPDITASILASQT